MGLSRSQTAAAWVSCAVAAVGVIVTYVVSARAPGPQGQQTFTVIINGGSSNGMNGAQGKESSLNFEVKKCESGAKLVFCSLSVMSPRYDRRFSIDSYETRLIDNDGDNFHVTSEPVNTALERDQKLAFKLAFNVNKEVVHPLTVRMFGYVDNQRFNKGFEIK